MANPMFTPETSTNQIYRDQDDTRCLTDDLDAIEADIEDLQDGKADTDHTHSGYAETIHTHSEYAPTAHTHNYAATEHTHEMADVDGLATALAGKAASAHSHAQADVTGLADALAGKASASHTHTASEVGAAPSAHTHAQSEVTGLVNALAGKANATHAHAVADVTGLSDTLAAKADLVDGKVPESQLPSYVSDIVEAASQSAFPATGAADKIYVATDTNKTYRWSGSGYVEISASIALGETSATAYRGDRGKVAYDHSQNANVHVTASEKSAWNAKQNALSFDTTPTANSTNPVTSGGIKSALDGKANASHTHNYANSAHTHAQSEITGLEAALEGKAAASHSHSYNSLTDKPTIPTIPASLPANGGNADTVDGKHASDFATANHTHVTYSGASTYKKVWIATNGNDNNAGTASAPMATIAGAIRKYAPKFKMLDISLADGTYNENIGPVSADLVNLAIRSNSEDKDKVTINMTSALEINVNIVRLYNVTFNVTVTGIRPLVVTGGLLYAHNVRCNVPEASTSSCVNVYNGCSAFLMHCVLNSGISGNGACMYGNQAMLIKAINCTTERKVSLATYAHNGSEIQYTDTMNATTKEKESYYGKCNVIS